MKRLVSLFVLFVWSLVLVFGSCFMGMVLAAPDELAAYELPTATPEVVNTPTPEVVNTPTPEVVAATTPDPWADIDLSQPVVISSADFKIDNIETAWVQEAPYGFREVWHFVDHNTGETFAGMHSGGQYQDDTLIVPALMEPVRRYLEGDHIGDYWGYSEAQTRHRIDQFLQKTPRPTLTLRQADRTVTFELIDIQWLTREQFADGDRYEDLKPLGADLTIWTCARSYGDALQIFSEYAAELPPEQLHSLIILYQPEVDKDRFAQAVVNLARWLKATHPDRFQEFFQLYVELDDENWAWTRYAFRFRRI